MAAIFPVTIAQEARLFAEEHAAATEAAIRSNRFPIAFRISARLAPEAIRRAIRMVLRHRGLTAAYIPSPRYAVADRGLMSSLFARRGLFLPGFFGQRPASEDEIDIEWRSHEQATAPTDDLQARLAVQEAERTSAPFTSGPTRVAVITFGDGTRLLVLVVSHTSVDGWSVAIVKREIVAMLAALDGGQHAQLPHLRMQTTDFALTEHRAMWRGEFGEPLGYWLQQAGKESTALLERRQLPAWLLRSGPGRVRSTTIALGEPLTATLRPLLSDAGLTLYVFCRSMFALLFHGYISQSRIALWANFANRRIAGTEFLVANCATQHPVTSRLTDDASLLDFCRANNARLREAQRHEALSRPAIRLLSAEPLPMTDTRVVFDTWPAVETGAPTAAAEALSIPESRPWVDLDVRLQDSPRAAGFVATFRSDRYSAHGVRTMLEHLRALISRAADNLGQPAAGLAAWAEQAAATGGGETREADDPPPPERMAGCSTGACDERCAVAGAGTQSA